MAATVNEESENVTQNERDLAEAVIDVATIVSLVLVCDEELQEGISPRQQLRSLLRGT